MEGSATLDAWTQSAGGLKGTVFLPNQKIFKLPRIDNKVEKNFEPVFSIDEIKEKSCLKCCPCSLNCSDGKVSGTN